MRVGAYTDRVTAEDVSDRLRRRGFVSIVTRAGMGPQLRADADTVPAGGG